MLTDRFDQPVSTSSGQALDAYVAALDQLFSMHNAARQSIDLALSADPEFALAHCVNSRVLLFEGDTRAAIAAAELAVQLAGNATPREQEHAQIVAMVAKGENVDALPRVRAHAAIYPRDALPLSFALGVYGLLGFGGFTDHHEQQVALLESVAAHWGDDWWYLSWLGWSYVETGRWREGVPMLDRALELKPDNANAAHGRAHGYYEMGAAQEAIEFIADWLPGYDPSEPLHCHIAWHQALTYLQIGRADEALAVYDRFIRPSVSAALAMFTMVDCAAFAWRARLYGCGLDDERLLEIGKFAEANFPVPTLPFVNVHGMLARALAMPATAAPFARAVSENSSTDQTAGQLSVALCNGVELFSRGDYHRAAQVLNDALPDLAALGGSHAQRDVVIDTAIAAWQQGAQEPRAVELLEQRRSKRAGHLDNNFYQLVCSA